MSDPPRPHGLQPTRLLTLWELDYKENWALKNWCFWTVVLKKTLDSPLDSKEIKPVSPKGNQSWIFIGKTDAEAEVPILWPPDAKSWLIWKYPDAGKNWRREEKETREDEMVGWHHWLNGHESEQTSGVGERQGSLVCCSLWGHKESDITEWLNNDKRLREMNRRNNCKNNMYTSTHIIYAFSPIPVLLT